MTLCYGGVLLLLLWLWHAKKFPVVFPKGHTDVFASVIVPVRNESQHIERLIRSIFNSSFTSSSFEVIIVDDHSQDGTKSIVKSLQMEYEGLNYTQLPEKQEGKKAAITFGVSLAKADLIVCTDGDSEVTEHWLDDHKRAFTSGVKLAFGPVKLFNAKKSRWIDMLNIELAALVGVGAATMKIGKPTMINGCNYSFSKEVFEGIGGFEGNEHIASGDDEFLLRKIHRAYPYNIKFLKAALVKSEAPESWKGFYHQRRRWASKWKLHQDKFSMIVPVLLFFLYGVWSWMIIDAAFTVNLLGVYILGAKFMVDYIFIYSVSKAQDNRVSLISFALLQIIYPFYVVFFGVASNFGAYTWRDRIHKI
ncbi:glycosyltransferase [Reichenbachiella sp.]|uniref:glycosyltransferase n=1 Tax=Reichenbachiella sp. TaxID=2184521 RepID=UPI003BAEB2E1